MLKNQKIEAFQQPIRSLADMPQFTADKMKAAFDACPEELRSSLNGVVDDLTATDAAAQLGFQKTAGIPANTVQAAMESVHQQIVKTALGEIPNGSVDNEKLAQDVRDRFSSLSAAAHTEAQQREETDRSLQDQMDTAVQQLSTKCELYYGTYTGDGEDFQLISLDFPPKMVLVMHSGYSTSHGNADVHGGMALPGVPVKNYTSSDWRIAIEITGDGFTVAKAGTGISTNTKDAPYTFVAVK